MKACVNRAQEESDVFGATLQTAVARHDEGPSNAVDPMQGTYLADSREITLSLILCMSLWRSRSVLNRRKQKRLSYLQYFTTNLDICRYKV